MKNLLIIFLAILTFTACGLDLTNTKPEISLNKEDKSTISDDDNIGFTITPEEAYKNEQYTVIVQAKSNNGGNFEITTLSNGNIKTADGATLVASELDLQRTFTGEVKFKINAIGGGLAKVGVCALYPKTKLDKDKHCKIVSYEKSAINAKLKIDLNKKDQSMISDNDDIGFTITPEENYKDEKYIIAVEGKSNDGGKFKVNMPSTGSIIATNGITLNMPVLKLEENFSGKVKFKINAIGGNIANLTVCALYPRTKFDRSKYCKKVKYKKIS